MQSMIQLATAFFKMAESLAKPHTVPQLPRGVVQLRCRRPQTVVTKPCRHGSGGIGFFNKEDSTRKGGTVQVRTSERIIRAE